MDTIYQRGKIQEESLYYEHKKHGGSLPLVGVNTFLPDQCAGEIATEIGLIRSTKEEKGQQIANVLAWQQSRNVLAPEGETDHGHSSRMRKKITKRKPFVLSVARRAKSKDAATAWATSKKPPATARTCSRR